MQGQLHGHIVRATKVQCSALQSEMSRIFTLKCTVLFFRRSALYYSPPLSAYYVHTKTQAWIRTHLTMAQMGTRIDCNV